MYKKVKNLLIFLLIVIFTFGTLGCANNANPENPNKVVDKSKTQIWVQVSNGGYGYEWLEQAGEDWEKEVGNEKYQIMVIPSTDEAPANVITNQKAGKANNIYFWTHCGIQSIIREDMLVDLTDIMSLKPDNKKTVEELLKYPETVKKCLGDNVKQYALPYGDSFLGLVFDFELFKDKGWLLTSNGELTLGKDGKKGTYDDGQPITLAEWNTMIEKITSEENSYPFIYTTKYGGYLESVFYGILAQLGGIEEYMTFISSEGNYIDANGKAVQVTLQDGYKVYDMPNFEKAVNFMKDNIFKDDTMVYPKSWGTIEFSHRDAQNNFLLGFNQSPSSPLAGMLAEGIWWEKEAKSMFKSLASNGYTDRGFGKRDYRYMLFPALEGQKGGNGDGTGSVLASMDSGSVFITKNTNKELEEKSKDFLLYTTKEKYLKLFTLNCGAVRPFNYTLNEDELSKLTPFNRNVWSMYNDAENITIIRPSMESRAYKINNASTRENCLKSKIGNAEYSFFTALSKNSASSYINGAKSLNSSNWARWLAEIA